MAGGLVSLLDDVAALAKLAAASIDDVGVAAAKASLKAAGVVVDDTAVTPNYVKDLAAEREYPIIRKIAFGSLRNKVLFILPVAMLLSTVAPLLVEIILMAGGAYLAFEGAHKIIHALRHDEDRELPAVAVGPDAEKEVVKGAIRTDFILSAEIMVISLKEVLDEPIAQRALILLVVAAAITAVVYGLVLGIVKMDDLGLSLAQRSSAGAQRLGRGLVHAMPKLLSTLSVVGTAAMLWVGGHILLVGADELGWHGPYGIVHDIEDAVHGVAGVGGVLAWLANTAVSALVGFVVGSLIATVVDKVKAARSKAPTAAHH